MQFVVAHEPRELNTEVPVWIRFPHDEKQPCDMAVPREASADGEATPVAVDAVVEVVSVVGVAARAHAGNAAATTAAKIVVNLILKLRFAE